MNSSTPKFSSRLGFILAAAGGAVGVGNIWGFPTQAASNGGGAFLIMYLIMVAVLAYPMLVAELTIGRLSQQNPIAALRHLSERPVWRRLASFSGLLGMIALVFILAFYSIISGWFIAYLVAPLIELAGYSSAAKALTNFSVARNLIVMLLFICATVYVVRSGVTDGIEKWSRRLMPMLILLLLLMSGYMLTQPGALAGLKMYLVPDFSKVLQPDLVVSAMGQAFFSLSIGVGGMMAYGAYLSKSAHLPKTAAWVAGVDSGVAILAGLLVIPAMFVAQAKGVPIYAENGSLISSDTLVFSVFPSMFEALGSAGTWVSSLFFLLMVIAAITSSISMLEAPVNTMREELQQSRGTSAVIIGATAAAIAAVIIFNFEWLFGAVISVTTTYTQPILGIVFAVFLTWVMKRNRLLNELRNGAEFIEDTWFWRIWPWYVKFICPLLIFLVIWRST